MPTKAVADDAQLLVVQVASGAVLIVRRPRAPLQSRPVLFAGVVQSMDIAAALDVERLREIMTEVVERSAAVVVRYGGGSVEFTGDG